ncbi:MAG: sarcosine oxidase subunit alpha family protein [Alphaproteobacteria bacterium]|nr:sarcosine oxidase subunit alpha family protein [Alphaproteobacteria bacterium]
MSGHRLDSGGTEIDRARPLGFSFNGKRLQGFAGDSLASALLANGVRHVARSFKYHRPRGILSCGAEEPTALVAVGGGGTHEPNTRATMVELHEGLTAAAQNCWPTLDYDLMAVNNLMSPVFTAGFYYKTFMGPTRRAWMFYEHFIRRAAGMGAAADSADPDRYDHGNLFCDILVVGAGPAGLAAARTAAASGARVILAEEEPALGGALRDIADGTIDGQSAAAWAAAAEAELVARPNVRILRRTAVFGYYDDNTLGAIERPMPDAADGRPAVREFNWTIRARRVILAAGAAERPIVFDGNDKPGVMLARGIWRYVHRYGVVPGRNIALFTNNDSGWRTAQDLVRASVAVASVIDPRRTPPGAALAELSAAGVVCRAGWVVASAAGGRTLDRIRVAPYDSETATLDATRAESVAVDCLGVSGGWVPAVNLASQAGGPPTYDAGWDAFLPGEPREAWRAAGAMAGAIGLEACLAQGHAAAAAALGEIGQAAPTTAAPATNIDDAPKAPALALAEIPALHGKGKKFVDLQHDVTAGDVDLAGQEGFTSVEHLKRYTTLGMACDQGKTSNLNGLAIMARRLRRPVAEVGTTRFRPPYTPVAIGAFAGRGVGDHFMTSRHTPMDRWHRDHDGLIELAGGWARPRGYLKSGEKLADAYVRETRDVRASVGMVDVSTLGKIDVQGPDAATFLDRVYCNGFAKLPVGRARYGLMLRDDGIVFDDGTTWRLSETQYLLTTTTANAGPVMAQLEFLLQTAWPELRVALTSTSDQWAGLAIAGPNSRAVLAAAMPDHDFANEAFPFMAVQVAVLDGIPVWIARLSFSGELAYEVYCGAHYGLAMWQALIDAGEPFGIIAYGTEALGALRIEKGHVAGAELDGRVTAGDLGLGRMMSTKKDYIGKALAARPAFTEPDRLQLVGLRSVSGDKLRPGAQLVAGAEIGSPGPSVGHVSSITYSPALDAQLGLGLLRRGTERHGERLYASFPLKQEHVAVEVVDPIFFDPEGERLHG